MTKAKLFLGLLVSAILVGGLTLALILIRQNQSLERGAAPSTALSISPSSQTKQSGNPVNFTVRINTGSNKIIVLDLELNYDPAILQISAITQGPNFSGFTQIAKNIDNVNGKVTYSMYTLNKGGAVQGTNLDAFILTGAIKALAPVGTYKVSFGTKTSLAAVDESQNVLVTKDGGTISVTKPTPTPILTPTPKPGSTATIQGIKNGPLSGSQTVTLDGKSPTTANPYFLTNVTSGNHTVSITVPSGYSVGYTLCNSSQTNCGASGDPNGFHKVTPTSGNSVTINIQGGLFYDLWWHFTANPTPKPTPTSTPTIKPTPTSVPVSFRVSNLSPQPGTTLTSSSVTFTWKPPAQAFYSYAPYASTELRVYLGTAPGGNQVTSIQVPFKTSSWTFTNIPLTGNKVYLRFRYLQEKETSVQGKEYIDDFTYSTTKK